MDTLNKNIFNIRLSSPFWDTLAEIYLNEFAEDNLTVASSLFLVPNRRACQALTAAFIRKQGLRPTILPQIVPIAEIDDDEVFFNSYAANHPLLSPTHTIGKEERLFLFTRLIMSKPNDFGIKKISLAQAANLSLELGNLIDTACNQGLSFDKLHDLVPEKYATHWQETLKLLKIITEFWPKILEERKAVDICEFNKELLLHQSKLWREKNTKKNIIAAGITASFPAIIDTLNTIRNLPNGKIYFAGIDRFADNDYWNAIDESHPQYELKELLSVLHIEREDITDVYVKTNPEREKFISEIMRPAPVSDKWRDIDNSINITEATKGIQLVNCNSQRDEAAAIAIKIREIINIPEKTTALVTYDRNLARRVAAELERFEIKVDDSAGLPLHLSPVGVFFRLIAESAEDINSEIKIISLLKHPFTLCHSSPAEFRKLAYDYEMKLRQKDKYTAPSEFNGTIKEFFALLSQLSKALSNPDIEFYDILHLHIQTAEQLATPADKGVQNTLWRGDAGKTAANFFTKLLSAAPALGKINGRDYLSLICELMAFESVRSSYGTHPRISILGPIEARLHHFDHIILGEVNEGIWPKPAQADMWMSRPMKKDFGFSLPEKNIGILAADLCGFLAAENVVMTRAERVDGTPMKKSRWLLRMETVLKALNSDIEALKSKEIFLIANAVDKPAQYTPIKAPAPCPPVSSRPRKLSASGVDLLIQDPYSAYAKYILKLYPLDDLDIEMDQRDYGTLVHAIIEEFNNLYPAQLPDNALDVLLDLGEKHFASLHIDRDKEAFWRPKFIKTAQWILEQEREYRINVKRINNEICGEITYDLPLGEFTFTAKADRIDELKDGTINIIDYKTGRIASKDQVMSGHALQLPLEGLIAQKRGFSQISHSRVNSLVYWQLGKKTLMIDTQNENIINTCEDYLLKIASIFDHETTPYHVRPTPKFIPKNTDYEHLSRLKEWSVQEDGDGADE